MALRVIDDPFGPPPQQDPVQAQASPTADEPDFLTGLARTAAGQGFALGFGDEIEAFARAKLGQAGVEGFSANFDEELAKVRSELERFQEANPGTALTAELLGGALLPGGIARSALVKGAGAVRAAAKGAQVGALTGGATGLGQAEGTIAERLPAGATGAAIGTAGGALFAPVAQGIARGASKLRRAASEPGNVDEGTDILARQFESSTVGPAEVLAQVGRTDTPLNIVDLAERAAPGGSRALAAAGRAAANRPGAGQARAFEILEGRQSAQRGNIHGFIDDAFGAEDFERASLQLERDIRNVARQNYGALHNQPRIQIDDDLAEFLDDPLIRRQLPAARELARADGAGVLDDSLDTNTISVKTLDFLQRAMRENSKGTPNSRKTALGKLRNRFVSALDDRIDGFRDTRLQWADGMAQENALRLGQQFTTRLGARQRTLLREFDRMSEPAQELFRLAVARSLRDAIDNPRAGNLAGRLSTPGARSQLRRVLGAERADRFVDEMEALSTQSQTRNLLTQGSRTDVLREEQRAFEEGADVAANIGTLNLRGLARNAVDRLRRGISDRNAEEIVNLLLEQDPDRIREILTNIERQGRRITRQRARRGATGAAIGATAGQQAGAAEGRRRASQR